MEALKFVRIKSDIQSLYLLNNFFIFKSRFKVFKYYYVWCNESFFKNIFDLLHNYVKYSLKKLKINLIGYVSLYINCWTYI